MGLLIRKRIQYRLDCDESLILTELASSVTGQVLWQCKYTKDNKFICKYVVEHTNSDNVKGLHVFNTILEASFWWGIEDLLLNFSARIV